MLHKKIENCFMKEIVKESWIISEAVVKRCFVKISQNSQENTCGRVSLSIKLQA